ncbi:hypothetical protein VFPFJ_03198 [Purpureocillium lilacinum]|nr:hypothetical protein VFPFJ_03198 [Purpureocillium lilacinum]OAQ91458.1 hypothetical protein VFPFJ_03198 [Purpureocillium lilacinum]GJN72822.1 hypothetical protein PLICBS_006898 [Purpureocillium lilacinum]GJN83338.1 hypothetical protein PLIIFM63780_006887 [Purpureocillium lilacinum]
MASIQTLPVVDIPGLHHAPDAEEFADSRNIYAHSNGLPQPEDQPELSDSTLKALGELFVRHKAHDTFGIHFLHAHFQISDEFVLYGEQVQVSGNFESCWTQPVPSNETFVPYEFQEGAPPPKAVTVPQEFFQDLAQFLHSNNLADLVALQLLGGQSEGTSTELLIGPQSTLTLDTNDILGFEPAKITTGWLFQVGDDGVISCKGNDVYSKKKNTHQVFTDSKPLTLEALKAALRQEGIIA